MTTAYEVASLRLIRDDMWTAQSWGKLPIQLALAGPDDYRVAAQILTVEQWQTVANARRQLLGVHLNLDNSGKVRKARFTAADEARRVLAEHDPDWPYHPHPDAGRFASPQTTDALTTAEGDRASVTNPSTK